MSRRLMGAGVLTHLLYDLMGETPSWNNGLAKQLVTLADPEAQMWQSSGGRSSSIGSLSAVARELKLLRLSSDESRGGCVAFLAGYYDRLGECDRAVELWENGGTLRQCGLASPYFKEARMIAIVQKPVRLLWIPRLWRAFGEI